MAEPIERAVDREARRRDARDRMAARGLDALLLTGGPNLQYFAGVSGMLGANSGSRPLLYLLPREGRPVLVVHDFLAGNVVDGAAGADAEVRTYSRLSSLPARELRAAFEDRGLTDGRIGAEFGPETITRMPVSRWSSSTTGCANARTNASSGVSVDCSHQK